MLSYAFVFIFMIPQAAVEDLRQWWSRKKLDQKIGQIDQELPVASRRLMAMSARGESDFVWWRNPPALVAAGLLFLLGLVLAIVEVVREELLSRWKQRKRE